MWISPALFSELQSCAWSSTVERRGDAKKRPAGRKQELFCWSGVEGTGGRLIHPHPTVNVLAFASGGSLELEQA